jgi:hypothetical protein
VCPFISFTSIPLVVRNLILVYPPQSHCEKIHSFSVLEGVVMDSKSASEEDNHCSSVEKQRGTGG